MQNVTDPSSNFRLAIAPGVSSPRLSALLTLQRAEEPDVALAFFEVAGDDLIAGLRAGRYDAGVSLHGFSDPSLKTQPLWIESMAVAMPLKFPLLDRAKLTIAELLDYPVFRWQAETCPLLDQRLSSHQPAAQQGIQHVASFIQHVASFEMMALWVAGGYGVGISARSRIERAQEWGISTRPLSGGPYEIVTHLQLPGGRVNPVVERFERRALLVAMADTA